MAPLLLDPQRPIDGIADVEGVLHLLVAISSTGFNPAAENGRRFLAEAVIASVQAVARHLGHDSQGGAL